MNNTSRDSELPTPATATIRRTDAAIQALRDLEVVLCAETSALAKLDFAAIDRATQQKLQLESQLETSLAGLDEMTPSPTQRESLLELRKRVGRHARQNQGRLEATLCSVKGLLTELTSGPTSTYGPKRHSDAAISPVLTSSLG